jgi:hypothetical protein
MTAIWPSSLPPLPLYGGFEEQSRMARVQFEADTGPAIERPRGTVRLSEVTLEFIMDRQQVETFEDFVFTELGQATRDFMFQHPRTYRQVRARMTGGDNPYRLQQMTPRKFRVSFSVLVIG